jgi:nitroreductase
VTDADKRQALGDIYRKGWELYSSMECNVATAYKGDDPERVAQQDRVLSSAQYLADNFERAPAMLIPCLPGRLDGLPAMAATAMFGSILPGVWSFMLAARERGLGTSLTTIHLMHEQEAAEVLGIPFDEVTQCALVTIGYTKGTDFKPAKRPPIETVMHWDSWGGKAP